MFAFFFVKFKTAIDYFINQITNQFDFMYYIVIVILKTNTSIFLFFNVLIVRLRRVF